MLWVAGHHEDTSLPAITVKTTRMVSRESSRSSMRCEMRLSRTSVGIQVSPQLVTGERKQTPSCDELVVIKIPNC